MNLFEMALAQSRANPAVSDAEDKYEQLRLRYNQLVNDFKNLQETYHYDTLKLNEGLKVAKLYLGYVRDFDDNFQWDDPGTCAIDGLKKIEEAIK